MDHDAELLNIPANAQNADDVSLPADAGERKRVLNILAQRRYRRRRRERQVVLESLVSRSSEKPSKSPQLGAQEQSRSNSSNGEISANESTPSTDSPIMSSELPWPSDANSNQPPWLPNVFDFNTIPTLSSSDTSWTTPEEIPFELNDFLQNDDVLNASFADDFQIAVPELDLLRAAYQIADRMHSTQLLFDMNAESVFITSDCSHWIATLPKNLQPTMSQLTVTHHPILDILPWPAVRDKLINMYTFPAELWPKHPEDGAELSVIRMVYDMEDGGVRVTGSEPSEEQSWEVEQRFFNAWWWALDHRVVSLSNQKRAARGLPKLLGR